MGPGNKCRDDSDVGGENKCAFLMKFFSRPHPEERCTAARLDLPSPKRSRFGFAQAGGRGQKKPAPRTRAN
jgi:hypothetical protein